MVIVHRAQSIGMDGANGQNSKQISIIVRQKMENFVLYFVNEPFNLYMLTVLHWLLDVEPVNEHQWNSEQIAMDGWKLKCN